MSLYWLHLWVVLFVFSIPFWPLSWLRYGVYIPSVLSIVWLIFNGCPITFAQHDLKKAERIFTFDVARRFFPNVTEERTELFLTAYLIVTTLVASMRLWRWRWR